MKILNLYFSATGNTEKVAQRLTATVQTLGHEIDTINVTGDRDELAERVIGILRV